VTIALTSARTLLVDELANLDAKRAQLQRAVEVLDELLEPADEPKLEYVSLPVKKLHPGSPPPAERTKPRKPATPPPCADCGRQFDKPQALGRHRAHVHTKPPTSTSTSTSTTGGFQCSTCKVHRESLADLEAHTMAAHRRTTLTSEQAAAA
jgi:hypothetical protein